jgi:hypothetical protein
MSREPAGAIAGSPKTAPRKSGGGFDEMDDDIPF